MEWPKTAEELMRSRFAAFRSGDAEWLRRSWHETTRPPEFNLVDNPPWRGLQILDTVDGGPDDMSGIVEFRATYLEGPGSIGILHERSRFLKDGGRWYYVDGEVR